MLQLENALAFASCLDSPVTCMAEAIPVGPEPGERCAMQTRTILKLADDTRPPFALPVIALCIYHIDLMLTWATGKPMLPAPDDEYPHIPPAPAESETPREDMA